MFVFHKVVEQRHVSLFPVQFTIEGVLTMLSLERSFVFTTIGLGIQVRERNEAKSSNKEHVEKQEAHIIETSEMECNLEDVN
jgi:hypothetical protein